MTYDLRFYGADWSTEEAGFRHVRAVLRPEIWGRRHRRVNLRPGRTLISFDKANLKPGRLNSRPWRANLRLGRVNLRDERVFWAAAPKGLKSCRTKGDFHLFVHLLVY